MDRRLEDARSLKKRDHELYAGSRAHYEDPPYYDQAYTRRKDDVRYYVDLAERRGGSVLEYGIGNGRIALPIARRGARVMGVDLSRAMIADLKHKVSREPALRGLVKGRCGDMRALRLGKKFANVFCTFNTLLHLYARRDFERFFDRVRAHLAPGGLFALDVSMPRLDELARNPNRAYKNRPFRHATHGGWVDYTERFEYDPVRQVLFVWMEFTPRRAKGARGSGANRRASVSSVSGAPSSWVTPLAHRQIFPEELELLLWHGGFAVERMSGDFQGGALEATSDMMVVECRRRPGPIARN